ncbi:hypothetical protein ANO14919_053040 [Xylariales sp. No.14919]|nr:hypothetical protein ANO14919_053040 [Xylariales sp. No.14919]
MIHLLLTLLFLIHLAASESVSITRVPEYSSQRPCAQGCFGGGIFTVAGALANGIGCDYHNPQNECVCRLDLQDTADGYLQNCVSRECSANTLDTNSAVSIYDAYCTAAGFIRSTPATITSGSSTSPSSSKSQTQQTIYTSQTSSPVSSTSVEVSSSRTSPSETQAAEPTDSVSGGSNNGEENNRDGSNEGGSNGGGNGLGTGDIVGIVVGILGFIATAIGTWFTYKSIKNKKSPGHLLHSRAAWRQSNF